MQETQAPSPGQEDPVEEEMATRSSILAGKIPWTEEPSSPWDHRAGTDWVNEYACILDLISKFLTAGDFKILSSISLTWTTQWCAATWKHIFVYMLSVRQLRTRGVIVSSEGTSHRWALSDSRLLGRTPSPLTSASKGTSSAHGSSRLVKELWVLRLETEKLEGTKRRREL